jgi:chain length determinant protein tyrosine kinase EpsG
MLNPKQNHFHVSSSAERQALQSEFVAIDATSSAFGRLSQDVVMRKGRMGDAYIKSNRLTREEVEEIVQLQNRLHIRFGEAAVRLGLLTDEEVKEVLDKQFNYTSSLAKGKASKISTSLAILHTPSSESAEAIKRLRSEVLVRIGEVDSIQISIVSPYAGEGKSHMAASLAISFAQLNIPTMLVDANLRKPSMHKLFGLSNQVGLSTMLAKRSPKTLEAVAEVMPDFWVLASGPLPPNPVEILSAPKLRDLFANFSDKVSVFIVDTPAFLQSADAQSIALQTGRALIVARENITRLGGLKKAKLELSGAGVDVIGTVYNKPPKGIGLVGKSLVGGLLVPFRWLGGLFGRSVKDRS